MDGRELEDGGECKPKREETRLGVRERGRTSRFELLCTPLDQLLDLLGLDSSASVGILPSRLLGLLVGEVIEVAALFGLEFGCAILALQAGEEARHGCDGISVKIRAIEGAGKESLCCGLPRVCAKRARSTLRTARVVCRPALDPKASKCPV